MLFILLRPKQRVQLSDSAPVRPHMQQSTAREGRGIAGEAAAATSDVTGDIISAPVHRALEGDSPRDDLCLLKGVGPEIRRRAPRASASSASSRSRGLTPVEIERLDDQLGAFRGRIVRDRIVEQADYLSRNDTDGFEQRFGKL